MPDEIIILSEEMQGEYLANILLEREPECLIYVANELKKLESLCSMPLKKNNVRRLVGFQTNIIVPTPLLDSLGSPAYNFHPGPPTYPGSHPASFAIYNRARRFGVTAHQMESRIDSGSIVGVNWFDIDPEMNYLELEWLASTNLISLFNELSSALIRTENLMPVVDVQWSGRKTTNLMFSQMRKIDSSMDEAEVRLRWRAFG